jgi:sugar O-acyltransferase (sialic acid O-acetyltransferase NeuD family)
MILYGASGHAKVIIEILEKSGILVDGLFDDNPNISDLNGYICSLFNLNKTIDNQLIISIGDNRTRRIIANKIGAVKYGKAIDTSSSISLRSTIGEGTVIMPGAIINSGTIIGDHAIINTNASVDHDCILGNFVHVSPGCSISGNVNIGEGTHIGTGASVIPGIRIGAWCIVGAGCVIIKDIPDFSVVVGNPGKIIKNLKLTNEI